MTVYALYNKDHDKIYIGQTSDIVYRLARHNGILPRTTTAYTRRYDGEWVLIYSEEVADRSGALRRERQLKSARGRAFIRAQMRP